MNIITNNNRPVSITLIGCGTVSRLFYMPALKVLQDAGVLRVSALADPSVAGLDSVGRGFPEARRCGAIGEALKDIDLAIIASPPGLHSEQVLSALSAGVHVLCEKPMAVSSSECELMNEAARRAKRILTVGHYKRFMPAHRAIQMFIKQETFGSLRSVDIREGGKFGWPAASDSFFRKELTPGGVLLDIGVHVLDLLLWWLGEPEQFDYADDALGNLEANCVLNVSFKGGTTARVRLSRDWETPQCYIFNFERATIYCRVNASNQLELTLNGIPITFAAELRDPVDPVLCQKTSALETNAQSFIAQMSDVCEAIQEGREPLVNGEAGARVIIWIEECYERRQPMNQSWMNISIDQKSDLSIGAIITPCKMALIGASGFIGLRATEILSGDPNFEVRPVVRSYSSLAVLARQKLDWRVSDLILVDALAQSLHGTEVCVHMAIGDARQIVQMAKATYQACEKAGVRRLVWLSSASVHGQNPAPGTDEETPLSDKQSLIYNNAKVRAERALQRLARDGGVEVVYLRPSVVYGPRSRWIADAARQLREGTAGWIDGGRGICNAIYVDNLVEAIQLAATVSEAAGNAFLLNDAEFLTWREFLLPIARHLVLDEIAYKRLAKPHIAVEKESRLAALTMTPAYGALSQYAPDVLKRVVKGVVHGLKVPEPQSGAWTLRESADACISKEMALLQQCKWHYSNNKAQKVLGYDPPVAFKEGMRRSLAWLDFIEQ